MQIKADSPENYIAQLPGDRQEAMARLREIMIGNLPGGFTEEMSYGMIGYVVPHSLYPDGYHADPSQPLPFICIASQKNHIALYHMGVYSIPDLYRWFTSEYPKFSKTKLDMGKSCIRFKDPEKIPFDLIAELVKKVSPEEWILQYESNRQR